MLRAQVLTNFLAGRSTSHTSSSSSLELSQRYRGEVRRGGGVSRARSAARTSPSDGPLIFFLGVVLFRVAAAVYNLAIFLVPAAPVVLLTVRTTISQLTPHTSRRVVGQWGGAGGAICEDHLAFLR